MRERQESGGGSPPPTSLSLFHYFLPLPKNLHISVEMHVNVDMSLASGVAQCLFTFVSALVVNTALSTAPRAGLAVPFSSSPLLPERASVLQQSAMVIANDQNLLVPLLSFKPPV